MTAQAARVSAATPLSQKLCDCGCGKPANRRFALGHYLRVKKPFDATRHVVEDRGHVSPCWIWRGATRANGYGSVAYEGAAERAHRAYYRHFVGAIPDGLCLDHLCRVRNCVNPAHLDPVTLAENSRRQFASGSGYAAHNSLKSHCKYGHEFTPDNTYVMPGTTQRQCRECRRRRSLELWRRRRAHG